MSGVCGSCGCDLNDVGDCTYKNCPKNNSEMAKRVGSNSLRERVRNFLRDSTDNDLETGYENKNKKPD